MVGWRRGLGKLHLGGFCCGESAIVGGVMYKCAYVHAEELGTLVNIRQHSSILALATHARELCSMCKRKMRQVKHAKDQRSVTESSAGCFVIFNFFISPPPLSFTSSFRAAIMCSEVCVCAIRETDACECISPSKRGREQMEGGRK